MTQQFDMDDFTRIVVSEGAIARRWTRSPREIREDYAGEDLLLVGVLKGAVMVMADLARRMPPHGADGLDGGVVLRVRDQVLWRGADSEGPGCGPDRPPRADRRRHHRLGRDAVVAAGQSALARGGVR